MSEQNPFIRSEAAPERLPVSPSGRQGVGGDALRAALEKISGPKGSKYEPHYKALEFIERELQRTHNLIAQKISLRESCYEDQKRLHELQGKFDEALLSLQAKTAQVEP